MRLRRFAVIATVALATVSGAQRAPQFPGGGFQTPILLRLEGTIHDTQEDARRSGFTAVSLGFVADGSGSYRWLGISEARTVGADQPLDGKDVLDIVAPLRPNLLAAGPEAMVAKLREAPPGTMVRVEGLVRRASRIYYLREVEVRS